MSQYYDHNFGNWSDMDEPETQEFYRDVQRRSVLKTCSICARRVKLLPDYDKCDSCCRQIESGYQY